MEQDIRSLYQRFRRYMQKSTEAIQGLRDVNVAVGTLQEISFDDFTKLWSRIEANPARKKSWLIRLSSKGFDVESLMIDAELALLPKLKASKSDDTVPKAA